MLTLVALRQGREKGWEWRRKKKKEDRGGEETEVYTLPLFLS